MKADLAELLKGNTLRNEIYKTISRHKFGSTAKLRNTLNTHKGAAIKGDPPQLKTEITSPAQKTEISMQNLSKSVNEAWSSRKRSQKRENKSKESKLQRSNLEGKKGVHKVKSKSQILSNRKSPSTLSHLYHSTAKNSTKKLHTQKKTEKNSGQQANHKDNSSLKSGTKINLQSIIEQSSSEQKLITPQNKNHNKSKESLSDSRTKKKQKKEVFSESFKNKIFRSFKEPETFQKIVKTSAFTLSYRIINKRLIEIEVFTLKHLPSLQVSLEKGNLQCQNVHEQYQNISPNTLLALYSAVRSVEIDRICDFPKISIQATLSQEEQPFSKIVILPYTWLHFVDQKLPSLKKSKIKTKLCLCDLPIGTTNLKILSDIFPQWLKKSFKGHSEFQTGFGQGDLEFSLRLVEQTSNKFTLQLQGKGEDRLTKMIQFLQHLIC